MSRPISEEASLYLELLKKTLTASIFDESAWSVLEPGRRNGVYRGIRAAAIDALGNWSLLLVRKRTFDRGKRENGRDWPMFGFTMVGRKRLDNIQACIAAVEAEGIAGDFVECGVWRGGCAIFAKAVFKIHGIKDRKVWLADSFAGMPVLETQADKADPDFSARRYFAVSRQEVEDNFRKFDLLDDNVVFVTGWFSQSLPGAPIQRIAILRLDGDHYSSTMDALNGLYGRVSKGGFIIIDDYNTYAGCKAAVKEFRASRGIAAELVPIDEMAVFWRA